MSKAIDKANGKHQRDLSVFGAYVRERREAAGLSLRQLDEIMGTNTAASWWEGRKSGVQPPGVATYNRLKLVLGMSDMFDELIEWAEAEREKIGSQVGYKAHYGGAESKNRSFDLTAPATAEAARWQGWGTALKPGWEIIVVARKPLIGTVAANILQYGTGALNIDATRIDGGERPHIQNAGRNDPAACYGSGKSGSVNLGSTSLGRWPANVVLDEDAAAELDQQSGKLTSGRVQPGGFSGPYRGEVYGAYARNEIREETVYGDTGGASRFFYTAKASKRERPVVDGVAHPTVKPLSLMRWLVRLVTPPGGIVLDPFAGSGPTIEAALLEGFHAIGVEREAPYLPLIKARLSRIAQLPLDFTTGEG